MIYLVSKQQQLFQSDRYSCLSAEEALERMRKWDVVQFDTETSGGLQNDLQTINNLLKMLYMSKIVCTFA